jgi:hypothetical protein
MLFRRSHLMVVSASVLFIACVDNAPTSPIPTLTDGPSASAAGRRPTARLTGDFQETVAGSELVGVIRVTRFAMSSAGQLLVSGVITGTADGVPFTQSFTDAPATLSGGAAAASTAAAGPSVQQIGTCDILFLDLGPLHLDVLGLTVDLSEVVLDINAVSGAGNLLGNLLCAVVHLLDGPGILASISNILDQINAILGAL